MGDRVIPFWVKWLALAAIVGVIALAYNHHVNKLIDAAVTKAVTERDNEWRKSEAKAIADAKSAAKATEEKHAAELKQLRSRYQKDIANAQAQREKDVAAANSGDLQLRVSAAACSSAGNDSKIAGPAAGGDGAATIQLPAEVTGRLYALADDADAIVTQLTACQQVILSDRKDAP